MNRLAICIIAAILSFVVFVTAPLKPRGQALLLHGPEDTVRELAILGFSVLAIVAAIGVLIRGTAEARVLAIIACLWPLRVLWVFGDFLFLQISG
jgi:hypothetical protein